MKLLFTIKNQTLYLMTRGAVVADSQGYLGAKFTFTADWNDAEKYVQFKRGELFYDIKLDENDECVVPWEVLVGKGVVNVNVYGTNKEGRSNKLITANSVDVVVEASGLTDAGEPIDPTDGILGNSVRIALQTISAAEAEALKAIGVEVDKAESAAVTAVNAKNSANTSATNANSSASTATQKAKEASTSAANAKTSETAAGNSASSAAKSAEEAKEAYENMPTIASQAEAEAGTDNSKIMTPLQVANTQKVGSYNNRLSSINFKPSEHGGALSMYHCVAIANICEGNPGYSCHIIHLNHDANWGFDAQIAIAQNSKEMAFRRNVDGAWQDWAQVYHSAYNKSAILSDLELTGRLGYTMDSIATSTGIAKAELTWGDVSAFLLSKAAGQSRFAVAYGWCAPGTFPLLELPAYGYIDIMCVSAGTMIVRYRQHAATVNADYTATYVDGKFSGWKKVAANGALSMPSSSRIKVASPSFTLNNAEAETFTDWYTAPADGYLTFRFTGASSAISGCAAYVTSDNNYQQAIRVTHGVQNMFVLPVRKGMVLSIAVQNLRQLDIFFYYAQSEV